MLIRHRIIFEILRNDVDVIAVLRFKETNELQEEVNLDPTLVRRLIQQHFQ